MEYRGANEQFIYDVITVKIIDKFSSFLQSCSFLSLCSSLCSFHSNMKPEEWRIFIHNVSRSWIIIVLRIYVNPHSRVHWQLFTSWFINIVDTRCCLRTFWQKSLHRIEMEDNYNCYWSFECPHWSVCELNPRITMVSVLYIKGKLFGTLSLGISLFQP